jgi:hypothetical protein
MENQTHRSSTGSVGLGIILILLGGIFLVQQLTGFNVWQWTWPLIVVASGGLLFVWMLLGGRSGRGLAVPASIVTMTGLILLVQNSFHLWQTWAYAWALIFPTAVGIGIWLMGWSTNDPERRRVGQRMTEIGLIVFLGFAAFFELLLNLSGFLGQGIGGTVLAALLILAGAYLLLRRGDRTIGFWR